MTVQPFFLERQRRGKRAEDEPTVAAVLPVIINKKMPPTPLPEPPPVISAFKSCRRRLSMRRPPFRLGRSTSAEWPTLPQLVPTEVLRRFFSHLEKSSLRLAAKSRADVT